MAVTTLELLPPALALNGSELVMIDQRAGLATPWVTYSCTTSQIVGLGLVASVSNSDGTLTISPTTGAVVASLALGHANTWTGQQTFVAPVLGTPASATLTNASGLPVTGITGFGTNVATGLETALNGSGALVGTTGAALITPSIGAATATSLAVGGATIGSNALAVTGTITNSAAVSLALGATSATWNSMGGSLVVNNTQNLDGNTGNFTNLGAGAIGWASGAVGASSPTQDLSLRRSAANLLIVGNGTAADHSAQVYAGTFRTSQTTVAGLPSAATAGAGARAFVTDATTPVFATAVTGGASTLCPVYSNGSIWLAG